MSRHPLKNAFHDGVQGLFSWRIWILLGWQDIHQRYRRSTLGPFWITFSMAVMIYSMGFLYAQLFKVPLAVYFPYLALGIVIWTLIASLINEGCEAFYGASGYIKQIKLPYSVYIFRTLWRNTLVFMHNFLAVIPVLIFFSEGITLGLIAVFVLNFAMILMWSFCYCFIFCILGTRFQDIKPIVAGFLQIFFLLTPILWMPNMLPDRFDYLAHYNPFFQLVNLLRDPLMGEMPGTFTYTYVAIMIAVGFIFLLYLLQRVRHRIAFWL